MPPMPPPEQLPAPLSPPPTERKYTYRTRRNKGESIVDTALGIERRAEAMENGETYPLKKVDSVDELVKSYYAAAATSSTAKKESVQNGEADSGRSTPGRIKKVYMVN